MIDTYLTLATLLLTRFRPVCSIYNVLSLEYRVLRDMKSLYLLYHCIVGKCFGIWDVSVAYNLWDDDDGNNDRRLLQ